MRHRLLALSGLLLLALLWSSTCLAATSSSDVLTYRADLTQLNNSGVSGVMTFTVEGTHVTFHVNAANLEPNRAHGMQIRGFSGETTDSTLPPSSAAGADGVMTLEEAQVYLGERLL